MGHHQSRIEVVALWTQLLLVVGDALSIAQGAMALDEPGNGHTWVVYLPLLSVLPAVAAFRTARTAAVALSFTTCVAFVGFVWFDGWHAASLLFALSLAWPLLLALALVWFALRNRMHRERESSLLHRHARANRAELEESELCGCIACERIYSPTEITSWVRPGETAQCPHCGFDAVVGSGSGIPITPGVLARAHARWFMAGGREEELPETR